MKFDSKTRLNIHQADVPEFNKCKTIYVKSGMGTGKTKSTIQFIKKNFADKRILFFSFRRTFASELVTKLNANGSNLGFVSYQNSTGMIDAPRIVVQFESLHRIDLSNAYDLVVLDESESIIAQTTSGLSKNLRGCLEAFQKAITDAKHVLVLDANLSMRSLNIVSKLRTTNDHFLIYNTF